jgi:hypothetical protein
MNTHHHAELVRAHLAEVMRTRALELHEAHEPRLLGSAGTVHANRAWADDADEVLIDGTTWSQFLGGMCVFAMDIAPDGKAWVQASLPDTGTSAEPVRGDPVEPIQTFVINPAVARAMPEMPSPSPSLTPSE